jgi:hypothetical protein
MNGVLWSEVKELSSYSGRTVIRNNVSSTPEYPDQIEVKPSSSAEQVLGESDTADV